MTVQTMMIPDADEARDNAVFEVLMNTAAHPGTILSLEAANSTKQSMQEIALALVDIETSFHCDDEAFQDFVSLTGALNVAAHEADFLFIFNDALAALGQAKTGDALYPDEAATIVLHAKLQGGQVLTLSGPGIETTTTIAPQIAAEFWNAREKRIRYPSGFDLVLVDGAQILSLPRSTKIEVQ